jgi:hypothetical protein
LSKKNRLTLRRRGEFTVRTEGEHHCGVNKVQFIRYEVEVVCHPLLDHRGFLFEQLNVDKFFQAIRKTSLSCEKLTMMCAKQIQELIRDDNIICDVESIQVRLCADPFAADMTYKMHINKETT